MNNSAKLKNLLQLIEFRFTTANVFLFFFRLKNTIHHRDYFQKIRYSKKCIQQQNSKRLYTSTNIRAELMQNVWRRSLRKRVLTKCTSFKTVENTLTRRCFPLSVFHHVVQSSLSKKVITKFRLF